MAWSDKELGEGQRIVDAKPPPFYKPGGREREEEEEGKVDEPRSTSKC